MADRKEAISGLRRLADLLEENPSIPTPYLDVDSFVHTEDKLTPKEAFRALGGKVNKTVIGGYFELSKQLDGLKFSINFVRDEVCTSKVVGTRLVKEEVIAAHEEQIIEWECPEVAVLGGTSEEE